MTIALANYKLFQPYKLAEGLELQNRMMLSGLTRARSETEKRLITDMNVEYYAMRAGFGLIVTEAAAVSPQAFGWYGAPALYNEEQLAGWKRVVDAVHAKGGKIFFQLWHMGRQAHSSFNSTGEIVSASAIKAEGRLRNNKGEYVEFETPRALETHEIPRVIEEYCNAARLAKRAGFDGIDILGGNGYLVDQFLQSATNQRNDKYGGSVENRARFLMELLDALEQVWPASRIGLRLAPNGTFAGMGSPDNYEQFVYTFQELNRRHNKLAYLLVLNGDEAWGDHGLGRSVTYADAKKHYDGTVVANVAYSRDTAEGALRTGAVDLVAFGRPTLANPDLPARYKNDWPIEPEAPREYWWDAGVGAQGYTTYKPYKQ